MKKYYLSWLLTKILKCPVVSFSEPQQSGKGWICVMTDHVHEQEYLVNFVPIESEKIIVPESADQLLNMNKKEQ